MGGEGVGLNGAHGKEIRVHVLLCAELTVHVKTLGERKEAED